MAETIAPAVSKPVWIDLSSSDPAASREFYAMVFGWQVEVNPDPQYGGYALAKIGGKDVAGIGARRHLRLGGAELARAGEGARVLRRGLRLGPQDDPDGRGPAALHRSLLGGERIAGAMDMNPVVPAAVPSYWMVYLAVADVDGAFRKAIDAGAREILAPQDYPGGRFAILTDPQGAAFGLLKTAAR